MKVPVQVFLVALLIQGILKAEQKPMTAEDLLGGCEAVIFKTEGKRLNELETLEALNATSYIDGYVDAVAMVQAIQPDLKLANLPEDGPKLVTLIEQIAEFIRDNPKLREEGTARIAVMLALQHYHPHPRAKKVDP